jgi:hypothetical protein
MLAGTYNITCEQGSTFSRVITVEYPDPNDASTMLSFNFTGYTGRMQIRRTIESSVVMIELTTANNGIQYTNAASGELTVRMTAVQTAALETSGVYDLEIINGAGEVSKLLKGAFTLLPEVTR